MLGLYRWNLSLRTALQFVKSHVWDTVEVVQSIQALGGSQLPLVSFMIVWGKALFGI